MASAVVAGCKQGGVDFYRAYTGLYVPRPLEVQFDKAECSLTYLLSETLALTKMNRTAYDSSIAKPITLVAARNVGDVLRYLAGSD